MAPESWLKISLPAFPVAFTVFGVWLYWGENPLPLLAPPAAFWGVVVLFYLFTHLDLPKGRSYPLLLIIAASGLWVIAAITSHNLGKFLTSKGYVGLVSVFRNKDFWYAYICSASACAAGLVHFIRYEPVIVKQIKEDRERIQGA
jgi:hypothetical protein